LVQTMALDVTSIILVQPFAPASAPAVVAPSPPLDLTSRLDPPAPGESTSPVRSIISAFDAGASSFTSVLGARNVCAAHLEMLNMPPSASRVCSQCTFQKQLTRRGE
jgi:hypothetical protein